VTANGSGPDLHSVFERPEGTLMTAIGYNKLLIAACAVLFAIVGAVIGYTRQPTYESAATLQVGQVNPNSPGFASYTQSATSLATAFSRAITAEPVLKRIEEKTGLPTEKAAARLSAEPIPQAPVFRVIAQGTSAKEAKRIAAVAASSLVAYENKLNSANPQSKSLLKSYQGAALELNHAKAKTKEARESGDAEKLLKAKAAQAASQVNVKAIGNAFVSTVTSQPPREGFVSVLAGPTSATGGRKSKIELYGFIGLLAGIVIGCGVAYLRERRWHGAAAAA
jgi:uncharacterized protein involved in exopolysaccharide biosynthesis